MERMSKEELKSLSFLKLIELAEQYRDSGGSYEEVRDIQLELAERYKKEVLK